MPASKSPTALSPASASSDSDSDSALKDRFPLLFTSETPDVDAQFKEFQRAGGVSVSAVQRDFNERIRYNRWPGRTSDYRKHRKALSREPVPWEGAWDGRVFLADNIIEDLGDVCSSAFERAQLKAKPTDVDDIGKAQIITLIVNKYRDRMRSELRDEAEYLWQFGLNCGVSVFQVGWNRDVAMRNQRVSMDQIINGAQMAAAALQQMPPQELTPEMQTKLEQLIALPQLIAGAAPGARNAPLATDTTDMAIEVLQAFARDIAGQIFTQEREEYGDDFLLDYELSRSKARQIVKDLRERGHATMPVPYVARNQPCVIAREVGYDYFCPPEMTSVQDAPWHAVREFLTPEEVFSRVLSEGWDETWAEEAIKTAGQTSQWGDLVPLSSDRSNSIATDDEVDSYEWQAQSSQNGLVEVVHFYKRCLTPERVREIYCTVWCPHVLNNPRNPSEALYAKHYCYDDLPDQYPFAGFRWQKKKRAFMNAMGIPQIVGADQWAIKTSLDMLMDLEEQTVSPQFMVSERLGLRFKGGPGAQITRKRQGDIEQVQPPAGHPDLAFNLVEVTMKRVSNYFGLMNEHVLPAKWQGKLQRLVERYLGTCSEMWTMVLALIQHNADAAELSRIAGTEVQLPDDPAAITGEYDCSLFFDVKDLDMEFVWKKIEAFMKWVAPSDKAGTLNWSEFTRIISQAIDPTWANTLIQDKSTATQQIFDGVRDQIALMYSGNPPDLVEMDPTAETQLEFGRQIIYGDAQGQGGNPLYQMALNPQMPEKFNPVFAQHLQTWTANRQQSVKQDQNRPTGRLGVNPDQGAPV